MAGRSLDVARERFDVAATGRPGGGATYHLTWRTGPADGTYGFSIVRTAIGDDGRATAAQPTMSDDELRDEAQRFVEGFLAPGGIGEEDDPAFVASRARERRADGRPGSSPSLDA